MTDVGQAPHRFRRLAWTGFIAIPLAVLGVFVLYSLREYWRRNQILGNQRMISSAIRLLYNVEREFHDRDLDRNGVNDYWTGDVAGLYYLEAGGKPLKLIPAEMAAADAAPLRELPFPRRPYFGYYFIVLDRDESVRPPEAYRQETDGKAGKVHHRTKFGLCAYPAEPGVTGERIYITGDSYNQLDCPAKGEPIPKAWPADSELMKWNRCSG